MRPSRSRWPKADQDCRAKCPIICLSRSFRLSKAAWDLDFRFADRSLRRMTASFGPAPIRTEERSSASLLRLYRLKERAVQPDGSVYVVDDDPAVRRSLVRLLDSAGLQVITYETSLAFL